MRTGTCLGPHGAWLTSGIPGAWRSVVASWVLKKCWLIAGPLPDAGKGGGDVDCGVSGGVGWQTSDR